MIAHARPAAAARWLPLVAALACGIAGGCQRAASEREEAVETAGVDPAAPPAPEGPPWFVDATDEVGLDFVHDPGPITDDYFMPQSMGSGAAVFDFDGDGRLDLYLLHNAGPDSTSTNRLFRQTPEGRFEDVSEGSGLDVAGYGMGAAAGDVSNDGRPDLCLVEYGRVRLFLNEGGGRFADVTAAAGLSNPLWGAAAGFLDYDRDGWLDLVLTNYIDYDPAWGCGTQSGRPDYCAPYAFQGTADKLYRNRGGDAAPDGAAGGAGGAPRVSFEDVTVSSGVGTLTGPGLGVLCADFDRDGWADIFVANDGAANHLWINGRDGTFSEQAVFGGVAYNGAGVAEAGMGVGWGDVDGDLLPDLFVTHLTQEHHTLWVQQRPGLFQDATSRAGLATPRWRATGFGTAVQDFDRDGALDIVSVSGRVARAAQPADGAELGPHWSWYGERNQLFAGDGRGNFRDVSPDNPALCGRPNVARGLAWGDLDGDGDADLVVTTIGGRARVFRNVAPGDGRWLVVRAIDPACRRDAVGAEVTVRAGERSWIGFINPGGSFASSNDPRAFFGLGPVAGFERIDVLWPDGTTEAFPGGEADRFVTLEKGAGDAAPRP